MRRKALMFMDARWLLRAERGLELADHLRLRARDLAHPEHAAARAGHGPDALDQAPGQGLHWLGPARGASTGSAVRFSLMPWIIWIQAVRSLGSGRRSSQLLRRW